MIDRYTIKATPAVSHKEIMKAFEQGAGLTPDHTEKLSKVKVRIELVCDYKDINAIDEFIRGRKTSKNGPGI